MRDLRRTTCAHHGDVVTEQSMFVCATCRTWLCAHLRRDFLRSSEDEQAIFSLVRKTAHATFAELSSSAGHRHAVEAQILVCALGRMCHPPRRRTPAINLRPVCGLVSAPDPTSEVLSAAVL